MILVFGKNGQVGTELQKFSENICLDKNDCDITKISEVKDILNEYKPKGVINAAAYTEVDNSEKNIELAKSVNSIAPGGIAKVCKNLNIPLIHISTDYVFDGTTEDQMYEEDETSPLSIYGKTKAQGELNVFKNGSQVIILRTSWVFSSTGNNFVKTILKLSKEMNTIRVVSDQIGSPTSAISIAETCMKIIKMMKKDSNLSGIFHYSGYPYTSWANFARCILQLKKIDTKIEDIGTNEYLTLAKRPLNSILNCDKVYNDLGIKRPNWKKDLIEVVNTLIK
mgnify:CR=1 FL=1